VWVVLLLPYINAVPGIEGPLVSHAECNSVGRPEGFILVVQFTITDSRTT